MKRALLVLAVLANFQFAPAEAVLFSLGNGTVLDTSTGLMWLMDANYAASELTPTRINAIIADVGSVAGHTLVPTISPLTRMGYGLMTWWGAMAWAQDLIFANYSDWRLPTFTNTGPPIINCSFSGPVCGSNVDPASSELRRTLVCVVRQCVLLTTLLVTRPRAAILDIASLIVVRSSIPLSRTGANRTGWARNILFTRRQHGISMPRGGQQFMAA